MPCFLICYSGFFILSSSFWFYSCEHEIRIDSQLCFKRISVSVLCVKGNLNLFHLSLSSNGSFDFFFLQLAFSPCLFSWLSRLQSAPLASYAATFQPYFISTNFLFRNYHQKNKIAHCTNITNELINISCNRIEFYHYYFVYKENVADKQKSSYGRDSMAFEIDDQHHHLQNLCSFHSVIVFIVWGL